ncbi:cation:proton antiporter [Mycobacterium sp. DL592]|uniref:cation:proton antiporter domain-containing protein n=1 Tax=Mycobacterium sp. DL592 TaxID=2675524 RepID=UPI0014238B8D|nr:cation:proton antiporter [Mycobacterium sp. DL592]
MHTHTALVLTLLVLGYAVVSALVSRWYVAPALIFVALGMLLGPSGLHLIDADPETGSFTVLAQLALTVILFNQAARLDLLSVVRRGHVTFRLLVIGIPLTLGLGALTAVLLLPVLPWWEAVCLAAIVAPTEVALIDALLDDERIPERVRHALSVESGFYDGFALAALLAAVALASATNDAHPGRWAWFAFRTEVVSLVAGAAIGLAGGWAIATSWKRGWMSDTWAQLATVAVALLCFEAGEGLHGSGFVAAFAGGLVSAMVARRYDEQVPTQVSDAAGQLLELLVFAMFGAFAVREGWQYASWRVVLFAVLAVFAVRLVAVLLALIGSDLPAYSRVFIGWFGPRGIGTVVLGLIVLERGQIEESAVIVQVVVVAVTISLLVHSLTAPLGIRRFAASRRP